jgi:hypothetical protein
MNIENDHQGYMPNPTWFMLILEKYEAKLPNPTWFY